MSKSPLQPPWLLVATPQLLDPSFKRKVVMIVEHGSTGSMGFILNQKARVPLSELVTVPYVKIPEEITAWMGGPVDRQSGVILAHRTLHHDCSPPHGMVCHPFRSAPGDLLHSLGSDLAETTGYSLSSSEDSLVELVQFFRGKKPEDLTQKETDGTPIGAGNFPLQMDSIPSAAKPTTREFWEKQAQQPWNGGLALAPNAHQELYPFRFLVGYSGWAKGQLEAEIRSGAWIQFPGDPKLIFDTPWQELWQRCMDQMGVHPPAFTPSHQSLLH